MVRGLIAVIAASSAGGCSYESVFFKSIKFSCRQASLVGGETLKVAVTAVYGVFS